MGGIGSEGDRITSRRFASRYLTSRCRSPTGITRSPVTGNTAPVGRRGTFPAFRRVRRGASKSARGPSLEFRSLVAWSQAAAARAEQQEQRPAGPLGLLQGAQQRHGPNSRRWPVNLEFRGDLLRPAAQAPRGPAADVPRGPAADAPRARPRGHPSTQGLIGHGILHGEVGPLRLVVLLRLVLEPLLLDLGFELGLEPGPGSAGRPAALALGLGPAAPRGPA